MAIALVGKILATYYCYALKLSWWWDGSKATHLTGEVPGLHVHWDYRTTIKQLHDKKKEKKEIMVHTTFCNQSQFLQSWHAEPLHLAGDTPFVHWHTCPDDTTHYTGCIESSPRVQEGDIYKTVWCWVLFLALQIVNLPKRVRMCCSSRYSNSFIIFWSSWRIDGLCNVIYTAFWHKNLVGVDVLANKAMRACHKSH